MITVDELKKMSAKELGEEIDSRKLELLKQRLAVKSRQNNHTAKLKTLRREIARIKTVQRLMKIERVKENSKGFVTK